MENELYHYGVKGMKWGVRRKREKIPSAKRIYKQERQAATTEAEKRTAKARYKSSAQHKRRVTIGASAVGTLIGTRSARMAIMNTRLLYSSPTTAMGALVVGGIVGGTAAGITAHKVSARKK